MAMLLAMDGAGRVAVAIESTRTLLGVTPSGGVVQQRLDSPPTALTHTSSCAAAARTAQGASGGPGYFLLLTDDKRLAAVRADDGSGSGGWEMLDSVMVARRAGALVVTALPATATATASASDSGSGSGSDSGQLVVAVGDKVGDVTVYPLPALNTSGSASAGAAAAAADATGTASSSILGSGKRRQVLCHTGSIITALAGTDTAPTAATAAAAAASISGPQAVRYLISADRDEKVRVSRWPDAYLLSSFCLGHTRFVAALCPLPSSCSGDSERLLASSGGDGSVRLWGMSSGTLRHSLYFRPSSSGGAGGSGVGGQHYGVVVSEGAHSDAHMSTAEGEAVQDSDGPAAAAAPAAATGGASAGAAAEAEEEAAAAAAAKRAKLDPATSATTSATAMEADADTDTTTTTAAAPAAAAAAAAGPLIPDTALGVTMQKLGPAVVPAALTLLPSTTAAAAVTTATAFLATFVEGEHAVRVLRVDAHTSAGRLAAAATVPLPAAPLAMCLLNYGGAGDGADTLVVGTTATEGGRAVFTLLLVQVEVHVHVAATAASCEVSARLLSPVEAAASAPWLPALNAALADTAVSPPDLSPGALHACVMTAHPNDYDKKEVAVVTK